MNPAKSLALRLAEHTPLLWGTDPLAAAVAEHAAAALATHAGVVAHAADIAQAATATALVRTPRHGRRARHLPRPVRRRARDRGPAAPARADRHRRGGPAARRAAPLRPRPLARPTCCTPSTRSPAACATRRCCARASPPRASTWPLCTWGWPPARSPLPERRSRSELDPRCARVNRRTVELLTNPVRAYAWGSRTVIAELLGRPVPSPHPEAELWLGAHPGDPSHLATGKSLVEAISADPEGQLGPDRARRWHETLPFLLKVLAADQPLSLQAHPSLAQARAGSPRRRPPGCRATRPTATTATPTTSRS